MIDAIGFNHMATEEIMQDVYMKMLIKINQYRVESNFLNWLLQIAKNQAIDYYRKNKKTLTVDTDYFATKKANEDSPADLDFLDQMMTILDEDERIIVMLKVFDELKFREIAEFVDKPMGTVLWMYQNAMKKMKAYVK